MGARSRYKSHGHGLLVSRGDTRNGGARQGQHHQPFRRWRDNASPQLQSLRGLEAAVARLTDTLAAELAGTGVRVNAIAPGAIDTRLQDDVLAAGEKAGPLYGRMRAMRETGSGATPPDVPARLALFLASDASATLTGKLISAPHDQWDKWDASRIDSLNRSSWYTIRRLDPFTINQLDGEP